MMKGLRFLVGRGELANTIKSVLRHFCLNLKSLCILVIEFVSLMTTPIMTTVVCHAVAVAAFLRVNLVFDFLSELRDVASLPRSS